MTRHIDAPDVPLLRVRGPADLLHAVPYLLGFHPERSLVVVGMAGGRVVVTMRIDLDDIVAGLLADTVAAMCRGGAEELVGAVFADDAVFDDAGFDPGGRLPRCDVVDQLEAAAEQNSATLTEALLVSAGRWWSYRCADPRCCPSEGRALDPPSSAVPATATYAGLVALPDRASLEALLAPAPEERRDTFVPDLVEAERGAVQAILGGTGERALRSVKRAIFAAARACDARSRPAGERSVGNRSAGDRAAEEVVRFGSALTRIELRDAVWLAVDDGRLDGRELWRELARALPSPWDAPPLFLFGWASWRAGNGALAGIAAERALSSDPRYTAADLLTAALSHGVDPRQMPKLRQPRSA